MGKQDTFPYWTDDWMKSQQEYLDTWTEMSEKMAETFHTQKPRNPWVEALGHWDSLVPETGESQPYAERMLDQGKAFFQMGGEISRFLNMLNDVNKSTDEWQTTLQAQMEEVKKAFESGQDNFSAFRDQTLNAWKTASENSDLDQNKGNEGVTNPFYEQIKKLLAIPGPGQDRERQEQQKKYIRLWSDYQQTSHEFGTAYQRIGTETVERTMQHIIAMSEREESLDSMREVYDLWIDCAEEAFADFAHSTEYREVYGNMINALMALKQETRTIIDDAAISLGLPSSKGFDKILKRMQEVQREIRASKRSENKSVEISEQIPDELTELRTEVTALRKELTTLKKDISIKSTLSSTEKTATENKPIRKKVTRKVKKE